MPIKTCKHNNKIKKKLSNVFCGKGVWVDNQGQEWNYCQGHICVFCKSNIHTNDSRIPFGSKARKAISHDSKANPFYFCNNKKECSAKLKTIESLNTEAVKKLKKAKDNLINEKLANDPQIEAEWRIEISPFIDNLFDEEENIIKQNFQPTPIFTVDNLKQIGDWIENSDLSDGKNELRLCYSSAGGKIDNVILEKEIFFTNLGRKIKLNKIKKTYIQKLENLDGWNLLNDKSQNYYQKQINKLEPFSFDAVIESAKSEIKRIKDDRERERERDKKDRENPNIP
ncbi:MAG: hypothetical protein I3274_06725, partial [Candidatus Moeniiplasma glomeromycotorum]|nr:hypothetical protein [Candidatus Moeniiplasma glomeromycotorum]